MCEKGSTIGWIGSAFFLGWACSSFIIPPLSDKKGRKNVVIISLVVQFIAYVLLSLSYKIEITIILMFICGFVTSGRTVTGYVYLMEFLPEQCKIIVTTTWMVVDGLVCLILTVYFEAISQHYIFIFQVGLILTGIGIVGIALYLPESPLWLLKQGEVDKAVTIMETIMV